MSKLKYFDGTTWKVVNGEVTGDTLPIGAIVPYGSATAPTNWLVCDGSAVSRTDYAELFSVIGTSYGAGDGSTTFNLPNLKGKFPVGYNSSDTDFDTIGETGGSKTHTQTVSEMAKHKHTISADIYAYTPAGGTAGGVVTQGGAGTPTFISYSMTEEGNGQPMNIMNPYQVVCYIIKAKQSAGVIANVSGTYSESETDVYNCNYVNDKFGEAIWEDIDTSSWTKASGFTITFAKYNKLTHEVWIQAENSSSSGAMNGTVFTTVPAGYRPSSSTNIKNSATIWWSSSVTTSSIMAKADVTAQSGGNLQLFYPIHATGYNISINLRYIAD